MHGRVALVVRAVEAALGVLAVSGEGVSRERQRTDVIRQRRTGGGLRRNRLLGDAGIHAVDACGWKKVAEEIAQGDALHHLFLRTASEYVRNVAVAILADNLQTNQVMVQGY